MIYDFGSILVYSLFLKEVEETIDKNSEQFKGILAKIYKCSARIYSVQRQDIFKLWID